MHAATDNREPSLQLLVLETTRRCNLRCIHCAVSEENNLGNYEWCDLPSSLFRKLLPIIRRFRPLVQLGGHGETLLHPNFIEMLEEVERAGGRVTFQTNGTALTGQLIERIVRAGVERVVVSLDGASAEVFETIRRRARLDRIVSNISLLRETKRRLKTERPWLGVEFVAMRQNIHELPGTVKLAAELGASFFQVAELTEYNLTRGESLANDPAIAPWALQADAVAARWGITLVLPSNIPGRQVKAPDADPRAIGASKTSATSDEIEEVEGPDAAMHATFAPWGPAVPGKGQEVDSPDEGAIDPADPETYEGLRKDCNEPWESMFVQYSGEVRPCCVITDSYGDLSSQSFDEVWWGPRYRALRRALLTDEPPPACVRCPFKLWRPMEQVRPQPADVRRPHFWLPGVRSALRRNRKKLVEALLGMPYAPCALSESELLWLFDRLQCADAPAEVNCVRLGDRSLTESCLALLSSGSRTSDVAFVERAYRKLLGREPDREGLESYVQALRQGQISRAEMVNSFLSSPELARLLRRSSMDHHPELLFHGSSRRGRSRRRP